MAVCRLFNNHQQAIQRLAIIILLAISLAGARKNSTIDNG